MALPKAVRDAVAAYADAGLTVEPQRRSRHYLLYLDGRHVDTVTSDEDRDPRVARARRSRIRQIKRLDGRIKYQPGLKQSPFGCSFIGRSAPRGAQI